MAEIERLVVEIDADKHSFDEKLDELIQKVMKLNRTLNTGQRDTIFNKYGKSIEDILHRINELKSSIRDIERLNSIGAPGMGQFSTQSLDDELKKWGKALEDINSGGVFVDTDFGDLSDSLRDAIESPANEAFNT